VDEFWPFHRCNHKSHVRKKKTAVHFITDTVRVLQAHRLQEKPDFCSICNCASKILYARFEGRERFWSFFFISAFSNLWCAKHLAKCISRFLSVLAMKDWKWDFLTKLWSNLSLTVKSRTTHCVLTHVKLNWLNSAYYLCPRILLWAPEPI